MTRIFNTRILASLAMIVFVGAVVASSTGAFFSDTETSTGNTFTAGAIDLQIDNSSYGFDWNDPTNNNPSGVWGPNAANSWQLADLTNQLFFSFHDLKPGDYGEDTISLHVNNNDAYACMAFDLTGTPENGQNEPEAEVDATAGANEGELQNYLSFLFWYDDGDNVLEEGETVIDELSGLPGEIFTGGWLAIADSDDEPLPGDTTQYIGKGWCFGTITPAAVAQNDYGAPTADITGFTCTGADGDHNDAQTDGIQVNVGFYAVQSRNNDDFQCSELPRFGGDQEPATDWVETAQTGGDATEQPGDTESGSNLLVLTTIDDVNSRVRYSYDTEDINLSAFTGFSFDSKQVSAADTVNGNASFRLVVDLDGDLLTLGDVKDVTYEPYYNIAAHNSLNDASIVPGAWQNWAATLADGKFWAGGVTTVLGPSEGAGGAYATNFTIQQLLDAYPAAKILGISIGMGTYNVDQVVHVDNLIFNGAVLGFE